MRRGFDPSAVGWRLGTGHAPRGGQLWVPWDRTCGVLGPQGSGKTLDLLIPALLAAPGPAIVTLTKVDDLLLSWTTRNRQGPCVVLDPFGLAPGLPELVWDPVAGCADPMTAERRAKAFTAGTLTTPGRSGGDDAARFYAAEAAKVLQGFLHAAALTGGTLDHVLRWVANPAGATAPEETLRQHPAAAAHWAGLLHGALHGDDRTAANTTATVQQAFAVFFQTRLRHRCVPGPGRPVTDLADLYRRNGTVYLLGRDDPYASAAPLLTAATEHLLDTALTLANASPWGRLCPPLLACLDELPSTAPLPTLRTRMANERALGLSFVWAAQTWRQLAAVYGDTDARTLLTLTNVLAVFGGSKDAPFNRELADLIGTTRIPRATWQTGSMAGRSMSGDDIDILRPEELRQLPERHALILADNGPPILARLHRSLHGPDGRRLAADQAHLRRQADARPQPPRPTRRPSRGRPTTRPRRPILTGTAMTNPTAPADALLVRPFPQPGRLIQLAYRELDLAANGTPAQHAALGDPADLPRPWDPATCTNPQLRLEIWTWLDARRRLAHHRPHLGHHRRPPRLLAASPAPRPPARRPRRPTPPRRPRPRQRPARRLAPLHPPRLPRTRPAPAENPLRPRTPTLARPRATPTARRHHRRPPPPLHRRPRRHRPRPSRTPTLAERRARPRHRTDHRHRPARPPLTPSPAYESSPTWATTSAPRLEAAMGCCQTLPGDGCAQRLVE